MALGVSDVATLESEKEKKGGQEAQGKDAKNKDEKKGDSGHSPALVDGCIIAPSS